MTTRQEDIRNNVETVMNRVAEGYYSVAPVNGTTLKDVTDAVQVLNARNLSVFALLMTREQAEATLLGEDAKDWLDPITEIAIRDAYPEKKCGVFGHVLGLEVLTHDDVTQPSVIGTIVKRKREHA